MKRYREAYQKHSYNAKAIGLRGVFKGRLKILAVFRNTAIKPQNTCTTQLASHIVFKCLFPKPRKIGNKSFKPVLKPISFRSSTLCKMVLISASETMITF